MTLSEPDTFITKNCVTACPVNITSGYVYARYINSDSGQGVHEH